MILVLSGDFSQKDLESVISDFSQNGEPAPRRKLLGPETHPLTERSAKKKVGLSQTYLSVGARTTNSVNPDVAALDVLNVVLGVGASSRLFIELREKRALSYSIFSSQTDGLDFGYFNVDCAIKQKDAKNAEKLILKEIAKLRNEDVPLKELSKGKDMILGDIFRGVDDAEACPEILAVMEMRFGKESALVDYVDRVKAVTADELREVAGKYLSEDRIAAAVLAPKT
jgi:zinc protease